MSDGASRQRSTGWSRLAPCVRADADVRADGPVRSRTRWRPPFPGGVWPSDDDDGPEPFFYLRRSDERSVSQPRNVRELTGQIGIIPGLYPLNHTETVREETYLRSNFQGSRSSQHARNQLLLIKGDEEFEDFNEFVTLWLPEIEELSVTTRPGKELGDRELDVLVRERGDRTPKELFWVGDGMQIFVQILTHLWRLRSADVVILDEPDLYLHADLQRRLVVTT